MSVSLPVSSIRFANCDIISHLPMTQEGRLLQLYAYRRNIGTISQSYLGPERLGHPSALLVPTLRPEKSEWQGDGGPSAMASVSGCRQGFNHPLLSFCLLASWWSSQLATEQVGAH